MITENILLEKHKYMWNHKRNSEKHVEESNTRDRHEVKPTKKQLGPAGGGGEKLDAGEPNEVDADELDVDYR